MMRTGLLALFLTVSTSAFAGPPQQVVVETSRPPPTVLVETSRPTPSLMVTDPHAWLAWWRDWLITWATQD